MSLESIVSHGGSGTCRVMSHVRKRSETCPDCNTWVPNHHNALAAHDPGSDDPDAAAQRHSTFDHNHDAHDANAVTGTPYLSCEPCVTQATMTMQVTPITAMMMPPPGSTPPMQVASHM